MQLPILSAQFQVDSESDVNVFKLVGPGQETRTVRCSPDKPMLHHVLLISSSHEKQTAIKPRAERDREFFYINELESQ